jgi:hypothetical protein
MAGVNWLGRLITEADNRTPSFFRVMALTLSIHIAVLASWIVFVQGGQIDFLGYAGGIGGLWAAAGISEKLTAAGPSADGL